MSGDRWTTVLAKVPVREGKGERESASLARIAFHPELPPVRFDNAFANRQPEACAPSSAFLGVAAAIERLEYPLHVLRRDAIALIFDTDDHIPVLHCGLNLNAGARVRILRRVFDEIQDGLLYPQWVTQDVNPVFNRLDH
jgi:hypothetical protein